MNQHARLRQTLAIGVPPLQLMLSAVRSACHARIVAARGVLRVNSVEYGVLLPAQYRVAAVRSGLLSQLSLWSLERAVELLTAWDKEGKPYRYLSAEIAPDLLCDDRMEHLLRRAVREGVCRPERLCLEFPADVLTEAYTSCHATLSRLKELGVRLAVSDVGGAHCPLMRLPAMPFDTVLLDRTVTAALAQGDRRTVDGVVAFARALGCDVIMDVADHPDVIPLLVDHAIDSYTDSRCLQEGSEF